MENYQPGLRLPIRLKFVGQSRFKTAPNEIDNVFFFITLVFLSRVILN